MDWIKKEVREQLPFVRFEFYKWGAIIMGSALITFFIRTYNAFRAIPDRYFYGAVFFVSCAVFYFVTKRKQGETPKRRELTAGLPSFMDDNPHFKLVRNRKFQNETVELDGNRFEDCQFENVTLSFHGNAPMEIIDCEFGGSLRIESDDPAVNHFIKVAELLRSSPKVIQFNCVSIDENGHEKEQFSSWTRLPGKLGLRTPGLRERTFALCKQLRALLDKHGKRPDPYLIPIKDKDEYVRRYQEEVQAWDDKFQADYWLNWKDKILALRHELALVSLTDDILDKTLMEADTSQLSDKTVEAINEKLRMLAAQLD